jgi:hypothetical protein
MRLVLQEFKHMGFQFSLIIFLTVVYFLIVRMVT